MAVDPRAGKIAEPSMLVNVPRLITSYYALHPDPASRDQLVAFGTSGHRGSSLASAFNEDHIVAISQAIVPIARSRASMGRCFLAWIRTRSQSRHL